MSQTALAEALGEEPSGVWATWETLEPRRYAKGTDAPERQPRSTHRPLATASRTVRQPAW